MMSLRTRLFIVGTGFILIILAISLVLLVQSRKAKQQAADGETTPVGTAGGTATGGGNVNQDGQTNSGSQAVQARPRTAAEIEQNTVKQLARVFVERYGSYSNQNNYENIKLLEPLVTAELWKQLVSRTGNPQAPATFVGVTTKVMSVTVARVEANSAEATLRVIRETEKSGVVTKEQAEIEVSMLKSSTGWLVSGFTQL